MLAAFLSQACLAAHAQVLMKRHPDYTECPDTHLRLMARRPDGSPAAGLRAEDLYLWFSMGTADIRSMQSAAPAKAASPDTNVLIVVPPQAALPPGTGVAPDATAAVLRSVRATPGVHWKVAVLAPDESLSPFLAGANEAALRASLAQAVLPRGQAGSIAEWAGAERNAFRQLQARAGRHVIVDLAQPSDALPREALPTEASLQQNSVAEDRTLDLLARDDMAQIYRLTAGEQEQSGEKAQPGAKNRLGSTGGRSAPTIDALFRDIVTDAPGSYDLVIHPVFSCEPGTSYSLRITSFQPQVQLYYPSAIRMAGTTSH